MSAAGSVIVILALLKTQQEFSPTLQLSLLKQNWIYWDFLPIHCLSGCVENANGPLPRQHEKRLALQRALEKRREERLKGGSVG